MTSVHARPTARTHCRDGGGEVRQPLGTGVFGQHGGSSQRTSLILDIHVMVN